ncbi:hypothetical protein HOY82DRAFT_604019 [Tuber indicum]|nr:hypothetical protein HOY82DRAFT_604019 [Tuber indicum]
MHMEIPDLLVPNFSFASNGLVSTLDGGVIRSWFQASPRDGKVSKLMLLFLRNQGRASTESPKYLSSIKPLEIVVFTSSNIAPDAPCIGVYWEHEKFRLWQDLATAHGATPTSYDSTGPNPRIQPFSCKPDKALPAGVASIVISSFP